MKTSKKKIEEEKVVKSSEETLDPFAVDFFGEPDSVSAETAELASTNGNINITQNLNISDVEDLNWHETLPKMSVTEAEFSNQLTEIPTVLSETTHESVKTTFSRFTLLSKKAIHCEILSVTEVNLADSLQELHKNSQVFLTLQCNPNTQSSIIAINSEFASALIDLVLGGKGEAPKTLRPLSTVEQTIIEFLAINVFSELNNNLPNINFRPQSVTNDVNTKFSEFERGSEIIIDFIFARLSGSVTLLLPRDFLAELGNSGSSLFLNNSSKQKLEQYSKFAKELDLKVLIGETKLNANDLSFLEKDDVILIENPSQINSNSDLQTQNKVFIGEGTNVYFNGILQTEENEFSTSDFLLKINEIVSEEVTRIQPRRETMPTKSKQKKETEETVEQEIDNQSKETFVKEENEEETVKQETAEAETNEEEIDDAAISTLENVLVNLRVQLGGKRLSLKDLQKICVGQVIELGCNPNDPVEIVTNNDNKPIATGELIEIEGQLGVRLTKIFV